MIAFSDSTVASEMKSSTCRESKSKALSYGRGGRSPKFVHKDIEGPFRLDLKGMRSFWCSSKRAAVISESSDCKLTTHLSKPLASTSTKCYGGEYRRNLFRRWSGIAWEIRGNVEDDWREGSALAVIGSPYRSKQWDNRKRHQADHDGSAEPNYESLNVVSNYGLSL